METYWENSNCTFGTTQPFEFPSHYSKVDIRANYDPAIPFLQADGSGVVIFLTANTAGIGNDRMCPAAVCVQTVDERGFWFSALNTGTVKSKASFSWLAFSDAIGAIGPPPSQAHGFYAGLTQPNSFARTTEFGDWCLMSVPFLWPQPPLVGQFPVRLLTGSNHGEGNARMSFEEGLSPYDLNSTDLTALRLSSGWAAANTIGAVPIATDVFPTGAENGLTFAARNQEGQGKCAFFYVAIGGNTGKSPNRKWAIETGFTEPSQLDKITAEAGVVSFHIYFPYPFDFPPVVLVTPFAGPDLSYQEDGRTLSLPAVCALGHAHDVTPFGFTLVLRNAEEIRGRASAYWAAFGPANSVFQFS